jgi:hypothetical protein
MLFVGTIWVQTLYGTGDIVQAGIVGRDFVWISDTLDGENCSLARFFSHCING